MPTGAEMAYCLSHNGIRMPVDDLTYDHLGAMLSIKLIFEKLDVVPVEVAFGGEKQYTLDDQCVKDLFDWKYLSWEKTGVSFSINKEGIDWSAIAERYRIINEIRDQQEKDEP